MDSPSDNVQDFTKMWMEFASKMATAGMGWTSDNPPPEAARRTRQACFQAMGQYADEFMRSPQFLEMMKQSMDSAITLRKQFNEFLTQAHHATQGVAQTDVDGVLNSIRRTETRVLEKLDELTLRIDALDQHLAALESPRGRRGKDEAAKPSA